MVHPRFEVKLGVVNVPSYEVLFGGYCVLNTVLFLECVERGVSGVVFWYVKRWCSLEGGREVREMKGHRGRGCEERERERGGGEGSNKR